MGCADPEKGIGYAYVTCGMEPRLHRRSSGPRLRDAIYRAPGARS